MRIGAVYDFCVNKGGGDFVMLNVLEALSDAGYDVNLVTSKLLGIYEAGGFFNKEIGEINTHYIKTPRFLRHPYTVAYMAKKVVNTKRYDLYVLSDDVPKCLSDEEVVCYIHYPHAARFVHPEYVIRKYGETLMGKIVWWIHGRLFPKFYSTRYIPERWLLIANSTVTMRHTAEVFEADNNSIVLLNPPVDSSRINKSWKNGSIEKEDLVVCIGRFELEKRFADVLHVVARLKNRIKVKLSLIGFKYSENNLFKTIKSLGLEENVELLVNAGRVTVVNRLLRAKAIIHPAPYEPFGIAVVEGMAAGCFPVVRKGLNGPWMEIVKEGKYGFGFDNVSDLADVLEIVIKEYDSLDVNTIVSRSFEYDERYFRSKFISVLKHAQSKF